MDVCVFVTVWVFPDVVTVLVTVRVGVVTTRTDSVVTTADGLVTTLVTVLVSTRPGIRTSLVGPPGTVFVLPGTVNVLVCPSLRSVIVRVFPGFCFFSEIVSVWPSIVVVVVFTWEVPNDRANPAAARKKRIPIALRYLAFMSHQA
jgi:hypothetical protein